ncbi:MAG: HEAT repeat domain-containing protein, partial [Planctomycetaceae bacterium]
WGPEGFLYMNQSIYIHSHLETPYGVRRLNAGGIWRFRPETLQLKVYARGWVNAWGHQLDAYGQSFVTDGAGGQGINYVVPGAAYQTAFGAKRLLPGLNPGSPKYCGLEIVGGRHLPKSWQNNILTNDFRGNRVCRFVISENGSGFAARQQEDLIKTKHVAFRPIDIKMGPDGAIYIADWYNPIIQHGEVDFRDPRRDHVHGRIWRVTYKGRKLVKRPKLVGASVRQLLDQLRSPELYTRMQAKRVLKERGRRKVLPELPKWIAGLDPNDPLYDRHRLEALWVYQSLRQPEPKLLTALLNSKDHRVRAAATRVIGYWLEEGQTETPGQRLPQKAALRMLAERVADEHPRVRMEAVRVLATIKSSASITIAMRALDKPVDQFLDYALWLTARDLQSEWLPLLQAGKLNFDGRAERMVFALKAVGSPSVVQPMIKLLNRENLPARQANEILGVIAAVGGPKELRVVFDTALDKATPPRKRGALLSSLATAARRRRIKPAGGLTAVGRLLDDNNQTVQIAAVQCVGLWNQTGFGPQVAELAAKKTTPAPVRSAAIGALSGLKSKASLQALMKLTTSKQPTAVRTTAAIALFNRAPRAAAKRIAAFLATMKPADDPIPLITTVLQRKAGPGLLAAALKNRKLNADVAKVALRTVSGSGQTHAALEAALRTAGDIKTGTVKLTKKQLAQLVADVDTSGDARRGEAVFRRAALNCLKCHAIGGAGGRVGPDLISIGGSAQTDYLIESLLEPSKKVKENYNTLIVATASGKVYTGVKVRQSDTDLILRDAEDREIAIPLKSIEARRDGKSMMPGGLTEQLTRRDLTDLVRFLSQLGKVGKVTVGRARVVRRWQVMSATPAAAFRLLRTSYQQAAGNDPAFRWPSAYSTVAGDLPLADLPELRLRNRTPKGQRGIAFARFELNVTQPGRIALKFNSTTGLTMWTGNTPQTLAPSTLFTLPRGTHRLTLSVDLSRRKEGLRVELADVAGSKAVVGVVGGK